MSELQARPKESESPFAAQALKLADIKTNENAQEAYRILHLAIASFKKANISDTEIEKTLKDIQKNGSDIQVSFGVQMAHRKEKAMVYSVKLEADGATKIITLRISDKFTELSLEKNGKLVEIMCEEKGVITHEKAK